MENQTTQNFQTQGGQIPVPNATGVLVLGIVSIVLCWCGGIVGIACGVIAMIMAGKGKALYLSSPETYTASSYSNMKAGRICAIVGIALSAIYMIYYLIIIIFYGALLTQLPWNSF